MATQRPTTSRGQCFNYLVPNNGPYNASARWYSSGNWKQIGKGPADTQFYDGLMSQNNPTVKLLGGNGTAQQLYYEDADGICRRAMGGYVPASGSPTGRLTNTTATVGLPMVTAGTTFTGGIAAPNTQSQSRPTVLHRPFRTVGEMSYAFRGTPWKNIDFFTPESGDVALLDVFCVNEPPSDAIVAGKVNLNTRQAPVLQAIMQGAYRDELDNLPAKPASGTVFPLSGSEVQEISKALINITTATDRWRGSVRAP